MSTCGKVGLDVHAVIKELAIRRVEHRSEIHSNESQHLAEGTEEVVRLRRRFSSFYSKHFHSARVTISADRGWRLRAPDRAPFARLGICTRESYGGDNRVRGTGRSERVEDGIRIGGGNGDGNGVGGGNGDANGDGDGDGAGTRTEVEANEGTQDGNGDGSRDGAGTKTGTGVGTRGQTPVGNEDESGDGSESGSGDGDGDGNEEDGIGEGGREAKKRKKPHKSCRRDQALSFRTRHYLCRQSVALAGTRKIYSQVLVSVHGHRTEGVIESERREGANGVGVGAGIGVEGGNGDGNGGGGGKRDENGDGDEGGAGSKTGMEANE